jgi:hypothetical protein
MQINRVTLNGDVRSGELQRDAVNLHLLPAQATGIEIGQQLRRAQGATRFNRSALTC